VIAIENVRLFEAEQQRTRELSESLEQQTATADVLRVISSSPRELEPVFKAILANAVRLCGAEFGNLFLYQDSGDFRIVEMHGASPAMRRLGAKRRYFPCTSIRTFRSHVWRRQSKPSTSPIWQRNGRVPSAIPAT
jgi:hypothetical protein